MIDRKMLISLIVLAVLIIGSLVGYGVFDAWVNTSGYMEYNHDHPKAQESKYPTPIEGTEQAYSEELDVDSPESISKLKNNVPATAKSIENGKDLYITYCATCHGETGDGHGLMGTVPSLGNITDNETKKLGGYLAGFLKSKPKINLNFFRGETDAQLFYIITEGGEIIMPGFHDAMSPHQRWDLINYIKKGLGESGL